MIPAHIKNRKGARSFADLDLEVIEYLNKGMIETANLMEWLATDQLILLKKVLKDLDREMWYDAFYEAVNVQKKPTANSNTKVIGQTFGQLTNDKSILNSIAKHTSDIPRCWAAFAYVMINNATTTEEVLKAIKPFAADPHFGVREVAIFASKDFLIEDLDSAISILSKWTIDNDENVRRFAGEALRPVGVWVKKIGELQEFPEKGLPVIEPLKSDSSKYVRDTVGNWLNDASKSQPEWVEQLCKRWLEESSTKETAYIVKKAMRTIEKKRS
ncbi:DNA alkylation repair protein [Flavobacteriaceae bacterium R38]|nr:DNA alkylation repair protein [Flavobacteriaceae bacterium R38]